MPVPDLGDYEGGGETTKKLAKKYRKINGKLFVSLSTQENFRGNEITAMPLLLSLVVNMTEGSCPLIMLIHN